MEGQTTSTVIDCQGCGHRLPLPDGFAEGGDFVCGHCGLWMRNVEGARAFRWSALDPFTRRYGVSRGNLIGGCIGATIWLPIFAAVMIAQGVFDAGFFAALAVPYVVVLLVLFAIRAGTPAVLWMGHMWTGLGLYLLYASQVELFCKLPDFGGDGDMWSTGRLFGYGITATVCGLLTVVYYVVRRSRLPHVSPLPPA